MVMGNGDLFLKSGCFKDILFFNTINDQKKQDLKQEGKNKNPKTMKKQTSSTTTTTKKTNTK